MFNNVFTQTNKYVWDCSRGLLRVPVGRMGLDQEHDNGGGVNKWLLFFSSVAMRLRVRTETISLTDMDRSAGLMAARSSLRVWRWKPDLKTPLGETKHSWVSLCLSTDHLFYNHIRSSLVGSDRRRRGSLQIYRSGPGSEGMEIHFRIISRRERRTFSAVDLAPLPIGLNEKVFRLRGSFGSR